MTIFSCSWSRHRRCLVQAWIFDGQSMVILLAASNSHVLTTSHMFLLSSHLMILFHTLWYHSFWFFWVLFISSCIILYLYLFHSSVFAAEVDFECNLTSDWNSPETKGNWGQIQQRKSIVGRVPSNNWRQSQNQKEQADRTITRKLKQGPWVTTLYLAYLALHHSIMKKV